MAGGKEQQEHLKLALEAAHRGDTRTFFLELAVSHVLDGIVRGLQKNWPRVEYGAIEAIVAEAVDVLYTRVAVDRGVVGSPEAYLWGTSKNLLHKRHQAGVLDTVPLREAIHSVVVSSPDEDEERDEDAVRSEALRRARGLLPRLGGEVISRVMAFIFDGIDRGDAFIDNETIAAALGMTTMAVRRSKSRGFQRLAAAAKTEGFDVTDVLAANTVDHEDDTGDE